MSGPFTLMDLPFDEAALEPVISAQTVKLHHDQLHRSYVETLNRLVKDTSYEGVKLDAVVLTSARSGERDQATFHNAGQVWNHDFYWKSLSATPTEPMGVLAEAIQRDFGSVEKLIAELIALGKEQFGSGWLWLVSKNGKLGLYKTGNAVNPIVTGMNALLGIDVWEHAYFLDCQSAGKWFSSPLWICVRRRVVQHCLHDD